MRLLLLMLLGVGMYAQTSPNRSVVLSWTDTVNPVGTSYFAYKWVGTCASQPDLTKFTKAPAAVTVKTWTDALIPPGTYCYYVTAYDGTNESKPSTTAQASFPFPPTNLTATVN